MMLTATQQTLRLHAAVFHCRISLKTSIQLGLNGHCGPYSGAFTLALRPCKKNLNPKPEFYFVKTQNPGLDKEPRVHKTLVTVTKAINKLCYSPHLTSTEDDAVEVNNFKDARSTQSINSTFYSSVDSTQLQHHMNDLIDPVHRF